MMAKPAKQILRSEAPSAKLKNVLFCPHLRSLKKHIIKWSQSLLLGGIISLHSAWRNIFESVTTCNADMYSLHL